MKTYATFGLGAALLGLLMNLAMFFAGWHGDQIEMMGKWYVTLPLAVVGFGIAIGAIILGMRTVREEAGEKGMSYGRGVGVGVLVALWQAIGAAVLHVVYLTVINPNFTEAMISAQLAKAGDQGMQGEALEMAEKMMRFMMHPAAQGVQQVIGVMVIGTAGALVAAAFLKRGPAADAQAGSQPPPLG